MEESFTEDAEATHTVRSLPAITLRLPVELRETLEAQATAAGQSLNTYLTGLLSTAMAPPVPDPHEVRVLLDDDRLAWVESWRDEEEDLAEVVRMLLDILKAFHEDDMPHSILVPLDDDLQAGLPPPGKWKRTGVVCRLLRRHLHEDYPHIHAPLLGFQQGLGDQR